MQDLKIQKYEINIKWRQLKTQKIPFSYSFQRHNFELRVNKIFGFRNYLIILKI